MKKLQNEYLSLAIGTSVSTFGNVNTPFVKAFLMGHIIGKSGRDITESEMEFINSIKLVDYDLQSECEELDELETQICGIIEYYYPNEQDPARLWEIVCDTLDIDYDNKAMGDYFDDIIKEYK